ncbi:LysR family transcriptional regulator [Methylolobus aquaticus]
MTKNLNYKHLRYFWVIANERSLTRAAERLHVSQSALSIQLKQLEESIGQALFDRENRRLVLTEAGQIAMEYANTIFRAGEELLSTLQNRPAGQRQVLRVGAVATLSRNFQLDLLRPALGRPGLDLVVRSGSLRELRSQLQAHALDLILSNVPLRRDAEVNWHSHLIDEQPVSLVSRPLPELDNFRYPEGLRTTPLLLPTLESDLRAAFDLLLDQAGIRPLIMAEVDDMAMLRLLARECAGVTLVPPVVVKDELLNGTLIERCRVPGLRECFYAITPNRRFPNQVVRELVTSPRPATA